MPKHSPEILSDFFALYNQKLMNCQRDQIYAADETNFRLDAPPNYTYETCGAKKVEATTSTKEMAKVSVMACATAAEEKLPLVIVVPRKTPLPQFKAPNYIIVIYKPSATFDSSLIVNGFLERYIIRRLESIYSIFYFLRVLYAHILHSGSQKASFVGQCNLSSHLRSSRKIT